jgi:hypothetical protein
MQIIKVVKSKKKGKKYTAILDTGKEIHFGSDVSQTFTEGASRKKRNNYLKRHLANPTEKHKIKKLVMSPALLSASLLWNTSNLKKNIEILNKKIKNGSHFSVIKN